MPMTFPNCPKCHGTRVTKNTVREYRGKVLVREWTYDAECHRCLTAEAWLEVGPTYVDHVSTFV